MAEPVALPNPVKECFKAGRPALGMLARLGRSGDIARIAKTTGHDFVLIDMQHAIFNLETVAHIAHDRARLRHRAARARAQLRRSGHAGAAR